MSRLKLGLLCLCTVMVGTAAMYAGSAQAALTWLILNQAGTTASELKAELRGRIENSDITLLARTLSINIIITCSNLELKGVNLELGGKLTEGGKVVFSGCEAYKEGTLTGALKCHTRTSFSPEGTIETTELKGELVLHQPTLGTKEIMLKIEPKTAGGAFATILTEKCSLPESNKISGVFFARDAFPTTHQLQHLFAQGFLTSLVYGAHNAEHLQTSIDGSAVIELTGLHVGLKWAAMDA